MPPLLQNSHILLKSKMTYFDEQRLILELEKDILILNIVNKFDQVLIKIT